MKKRLLSAAVLVGLALVLMISGCADRNVSYAESESKTKPQLYTESDKALENETQETMEYQSLIDKYVMDSGAPYRASAYMLKKLVTNNYPAEEWLGSDGKLSLPFNPDAIKTYASLYYQGHSRGTSFLDETIGVTSYYVPDELAVKASTGELADIFLSYGYNSGLIMTIASPPVPDEFEAEFEYDLSHCNALEESLRREDFGGEYFERYMAETENMPEYREGMEDEDFSVYLTYMSECDKTNTLNMIEVILAQPEAFSQLTEEQRVMLVRRVIEREKLGEQKKLFFSSSEYRSFFFTCIAGDCYLSGEAAYTPDIKGEIRWEDNPWIDAIKEMNLTEDEREVTDGYLFRKQD